MPEVEARTSGTHQHILMIEGGCTVEHHVQHIPAFSFYSLTHLTLPSQINLQMLLFSLFFNESNIYAVYNYVLAACEKLFGTFSYTRSHMYKCQLKLCTKLLSTFSYMRLHKYKCLLKHHTKLPSTSLHDKTPTMIKLNLSALEGWCCDLWVADEITFFSFTLKLTYLA